MTLRRLAFAGIVVAVLAVATPAWPQTYVGVTPPTVEAVDSAVAPSVTEAPSRGPSGIAFTGADVVELVAIAALALAAGGLAVRGSSLKSASTRT